MAGFSPLAQSGAGGSAALTPPVHLEGTDIHTTPLVVEGATGQDAPTFAVIQQGGVDANGMISCGAFGVTILGDPVNGNLSGMYTEGTHVDVLDETGTRQIVVTGLGVVLGSAEVTRVLPAGAVVIGDHAAPANADLANGEMALWFDQSAGAAKLMVKAKDAGGTVRTAAVALS